MTASQQPTGHDKADTLARLRVIVANEALIAAGLWHPPTQPTYHHHPDCPQGDRCWCSQRWVRIERSAT